MIGIGAQKMSDPSGHWKCSYCGQFIAEGTHHACTGTNPYTYSPLLGETNEQQVARKLNEIIERLDNIENILHRLECIKE